MSHFTQLHLPEYDLYAEMNRIMSMHGMTWHKSNQICLNHISSNSTDTALGTGSLFYDWDQAETIITETGESKIVVPERKHPLHESDFVYLCKQFENTRFEEVYHTLRANYNLGRVRLMLSKPKTCLSWHVDGTRRIHYPIKTQEGCLMVIEDEVVHLTANNWWLTNTVIPHTAMNASKEDRIHLVAVCL